MDMSIEGLLGAPVIAFVASLVIAVILYAIGGSIAPKPKSSSKAKYQPYACGQEVPPERVPMTIWLYKFAMAFVVVDVVSFLFILSMGTPLVTPLRELILIYGMLLLIALVALIRR